MNVCVCMPCSKSSTSVAKLELGLFGDQGFHLLVTYEENNVLLHKTAANFTFSLNK